ncbi:hypothetical protein K474DRAFT_812072 [Panus rudis PR-1116 ss-1]|nr:hypothetical protein K474DRAFT_812072 [Panus rudis PR-1116 ss-1]
MLYTYKNHTDVSRTHTNIKQVQIHLESVVVLLLPLSKYIIFSLKGSKTGSRVLCCTIQYFSSTLAVLRLYRQRDPTAETFAGAPFT